VQLLLRDKLRVTLTPAGRVALERARQLLKDQDDLVLATRRAAHGEIGIIRIGFISFVAYEYLPAILRAFRAEVPDVGIELHEFMVMQQFEMLLDNRIDVAVLRPLYEDSRILTQPIVRSRFVVALPAGHRLLRKRSVKMTDLAGEDLVSLPKRIGPSFYGQIMSFCSRAGFVPNVVREASDAQAVIGLVAAGMGVAVVPESVRKLNTDGVEYRLISDIPETAEIVLAWEKANNSEVLKRFVRIAAKALRKD
jgi:DNA-binding transcriptional LysR family regulator